MKITITGKRKLLSVFLIVVLWPLLPGCVATRNWVKEQMDPLAGRVSDGEKRLGQTEGKIDSVGQRVSGVEGRVGQIDAKADKALSSLANLRLEKRLVLDLKEGASFAFNSAKLPADARREIDGFLGDLKGDARGVEEAMFLVTGHTDSTGPAEYNYELGKKRAESVARYLITQEQMDPLRVITVSYGKESPLADNDTREGRAKNRRVEILVYRERIISGDKEPGPTAEAPATNRSDERLSSSKGSRSER